MTGAVYGRGPLKEPPILTGSEIVQIVRSAGCPETCAKPIRRPDFVPDGCGPAHHVALVVDIAYETTVAGS